MPRVMEITTPLGADVLLFHRMHAREEMSRLFEYHLELLSKRDDIAMDDVLGKSVTVKLVLPDDTTRYFNGFLTRFGQGGTIGRYHRYSAVVRPWLWFLTRTADCRIFQEMTVPDILKAVFGDHETADFKFELTNTYRKRNYCVQYRETDFNFVSRLMEEEGIYYYSTHTDGHNTLIVTDSYIGSAPFPGYEKIPFIAPERLARGDVEHISSWERTQEVQPGSWVHDDYDFDRPGVELRTQKKASRKFAPVEYEIYDYPGHYLQKSDGEQYAGVRVDEFGTQFETASAATNAKGVSVGNLFTLDGHSRLDQNREHLVVAASYDLEFSGYEAMPETSGATYSCHFVAMSTQQQFRPRRLTAKPFVQGPQTAVVVGPKGDEIYKDDLGRVKVQFHWDRYGKKDENSSCWIRVSQMWAGKGWGSVSTPRIGHEVIVDFLEGDPDQPIILGSIHNAENKPPHTGVVSGLKSNTHKGKGSNEMTMDDTAGKEKITIHGQYDMGTTVEHDQTNTVNNKFTETIKSDAKISITEGTYSHDVVAGTAKYHVQGALDEKYDATQSTTVKDDLTIKATAGAIRISSNSQCIELKAATYIQLECGASKIKLDSGGNISVDGIVVAINGKASVTTNGGIVDSIAKAQHQIKGAIVISDAGGTNTIKGSMVMLN